MDDHVLFQRARRGDENAFAELFARYQRPLFRYAAYVCGQAAADDVVQETFLAVLRQGHRTDAPDGTIQAYLFGIARHLMLKRLSSSRERALGEEIDSVVEVTVAVAADSALDEYARQESASHLRAAVQALPREFREVIVVCALEDLSYADAAAVLQCPIGTVRSRLYRAKAMLASALAPVVGRSSSC